MSLSRELIVAAKTRADAATEGPWFDADSDSYGGLVWFAETTHDPSDPSGQTAMQVQSIVGSGMNRTDAIFIASAREDVPVMADALLRVLDIHTPEERAHDGSGEWSIPLSEWDDDETPETFTVCSHCGAIEMRESQGESEFASYLEALWPCATVRAVTGDGSSSNTERSTT
jgi:hypothetical protein